MSGPIIRTGSNEEFAQGWDRIFGGKKKSAGDASKTEPKAVAKKKAKTAKTAKPAKKAAKKKASK